MNDHIKNIETVQNFKTRLASLLQEFGASISSGVEGDTHGVWGDQVIFQIGDSSFSLPTDLREIDHEVITKTIGTEVLAPAPVKPVKVEALTVFPAGARVCLKKDYIRSLHSGWHKAYTGRQGTVAHPPSPRSEYTYIQWDDEPTGPTHRVKGYPLHAVEAL